ncbi:ABC-2 family transporter protein [Synechococcus sp. M16CYN]|uniref:ABC transporter permease n=1 Tax=Synechococcus sp. M16CYN TaxID=3103139 RepID=UPI0032552432
MRLFGLNCRIVAAILGSQYAHMLEYRAEIALWSLSGVLPLIMLSVWSSSGIRTTLDMNDVALDRYFLSAFLVRQFSVVWVVYAFEEDVLLGRLSPYLLQPLHPLWRYVAAHLSEQFTRLPFAAAIAALFLLIQPKVLWLPGPGTLLLAWLATWMAFAIAFLLQSLIAALCFWSEKASALERLLFIPFVFLSGLLTPLTAFPPAMQAVARWTPFPYLIDFPARVLAQRPVDWMAGFCAQLIWITLLLPLALCLWRAGVRRYSAMGA